MDCNLSTVLYAANLTLEEPVIQHATKTGKLYRAPGHDGICQEFLKKTWETTKGDFLHTVNEMYSDALISEHQKFGIIVCILKQPNALHIDDYRPPTILNTDFNLVTRIIANHLRQWMPDLLQDSQYCGLMNTSVFEAIATIKDAFDYAEVTRTPLCVLSTEFQGAFYNVSHEYLFEVLYKYGFSEHLMQRIWNIYNNSTSLVQLRYRSYSFLIKSSIHQGCPLSMILFAMCLNPLLHNLGNSLHGLWIGRHRTMNISLEYADVTIFITELSDIPELQEAIHCYEAASGARVNFQKSREIALGSWGNPLKLWTIHTMILYKYWASR